MLPPYRGIERPCRAAEPDRDVPAKMPAKASDEPETDSYGRVVLKSSLRVLEPAVRQAKLTIVK